LPVNRLGIRRLLLVVLAAAAAAIATQNAAMVAIIAASESLTQARTRRKTAEHFELHPGRGLWDDFADIFDRRKRRAMDPDRKLRLEREFQSIFRLIPPAFLFVADAIRGIVGRQPGARGPAPMKFELGLAIVLYNLSTGCSYKQVCHVMRSDMSQSHIMHCTRL
jgi:hypothetical protein